MNNNVSVFGGSGFLGEYLVKELVRQNFKVSVLDINPPNYPVVNFDYYNVDIMNPQNIEEALLETDADYIYNLAGFANLDEAVKHPKSTIELNVIGNINILNACIKKNIKRYIYASSAYAVSLKGSFYGISKLASEKIIEEYKRKFKLPFTILRYGSVYSESEYENNYLFNLIESAIITGRINHKGDGQELREYLHASDAAQLSIKVMDEQFENQYVILTGMEKMRRIELFEMIKEMLSKEIDIKLEHKTIGDHYKLTPYSFEPSISKKLVSNPYIDMGQGILECIKAVYKKNNKIEEIKIDKK